jgi:hypothetical protein
LREGAGQTTKSVRAHNYHRGDKRVILYILSAEVWNITAVISFHQRLKSDHPVGYTLQIITAVILADRGLEASIQLEL